ncbi:ribbon-helix-helix domain-containing protein [Staphylococcus sp. Marseille-Q6910]|uniref:ribbon-helix-helix domain-containing protein n=1 Tax=Staphylococcus sp. Marseille-Q6910 TaxID=2937990 RepID=UPI00203F70F5|nr:ribbon-helix-helix domain-containing protein [Staphylococcus sp. Marseille-Q6910]
MKEDKLRKRVYIDRKLNEVLTEMAKEKGMNSNEFIEQAIEFFIEYENGNIENDNIFTNRINELTQQVSLLRHESSAYNQSLLNKMEIIADLQNPTDYLN